MTEVKESKRPRSKIQASIEKARQDQRLDVFRKRIDHVKQGLKAFEANKNADAIKFFTTYLKILEDWKDVSPGGLNPSYFNLKKEVPEILLINAVYWTLTKIYDKSQSATGKEFFQCLEKFLVFSKGMSHQKLSAEHIRIYINQEKPMHKDALKNAYKLIGGGGCFIASSLLDVTDEKTFLKLRKFKADVLEKNETGKLFIKCYYYVGPPVAFLLDRLPLPFRKACGKSLDIVARVLMQ